MGPTRERILSLLKRRKRATARELAEALAVTAPAARQHLIALERDGLVGARAEKRPMGRPVRVYALAPAAEPHFPTAYGPLALELFRIAKRSGGARGVARLLDKRRAGQAKAYRARLRRTGKSRAWAALAKLRDAEGFVAEAPGTPGQPTLVEHHCPIRAVASEFPEVCRQEQLLFEAVLGCRLQRSEHLLDGGRCCRYEPGAGAAKRRTGTSRRTAARRRAASGTAKPRPAAKKRTAKKRTAKKRTAKKASQAKRRAPAQRR